MKFNRAKTVDLVERTVATFVQAFLAVVLVNSTNLTNIHALKIAAVAGGLAVVKWVGVWANKKSGIAS